MRSPYEFCAICGVRQKTFLNDEKKLLRLQKQQLKSERKRYFDGIIKNSEQTKFAEKLSSQYESYLNKNEKILLYYKENIIRSRAGLIYIGILTLINIIFFFLILFFIFNNSFGYIGFLYLFLSFLGFIVFACGPICLPFLFSFNRCLFTSQKIIFKKFIKNKLANYNNIILITVYDNRKYFEDIYFELNPSIESNIIKNKIMFALRFIPKNLNLYEKIVKLRDQFKNQ